VEKFEQAKRLTGRKNQRAGNQKTKQMGRKQTGKS